jgi:predicted glycosyltransferase
MGELEPTLRRMRATGGTRAVLGLRDILDTPERVAQAWAENGNSRMVSDLYDGVLVYGDPAFFDSAAAYRLPARTQSCGVVTTPRRGRRRHHGRAPARILVSGGGGRDAYPLIDATITAMSRIPSTKRPKMTIVTGPLMDEELRIEAIRRAGPLGITVETHIADLPGEMEKADLFVAMTGYNSINEALALNCPVVTVPRLGPSAEQRMRADRLETLGLARVLHREALSAGALARLLTAPLPKPPTMTLRLNGAETAAAHLETIIATDRTEQETAHVAET